MTQILIFFALLFALSNIDTKKFDLAITSLQGSLGILETGPAVSEGNLVGAGEMGESLKSVQEQRQMENLEQNLEEILSRSQIKGVQVNMEERGIVVRFTEGVLFDSGKADLKKEAISILDRIVPVLKNSHRQIRVEGHTDNVPINTPEFPSNWELSTTRAVNVVRYLIEKHNFSPYILSAAGYGEYRPIAPNDSEKHRAMNRRVDIVILKSVSESEEPR
jgi:chemotaxis protein MotB